MIPAFQPGARISARDVAFLLVSGGVAWWAHGKYGPWLAQVIAFVVGNFFLFCNVFRVARMLELAWTAVFLVLAGIRLQTAAIEWPTVFLICGGLTALVVVMEMRHPSYHGLGWSTINPGLEDWWRQRFSTPSSLPVSKLET